MSTIVVHAFITLDGVVQAGGGPDDDREGGFEHGGWMMKYDEHTDSRFMNHAAVWTKTWKPPGSSPVGPAT